MNIETPPCLVVITGPTAVGKTSLSIRIAKHFNTEIISADSRQFYREMIIGTACPTEDQLREVPHHFIRHISIHDPYNVSRFESEVLGKLKELFRNHKLVVMTGGSGLYIEAVCNGIDDLPDPDDNTRLQLKEILRIQGIQALRNKLKILDPVYYDQVDLSNPKRLLRALEVCISTGVPFSTLRRNQPKQRDFRIIRIGLETDRQELYRRINDRTDEMMRRGLADEAKSLYPFRNLNALNTVGYKELFSWIDGTITLTDAVAKIKTNTRRYAKRQMTWFRKQEETKWFEPGDEENIVQYINYEIRKNDTDCG